MIDFKNPAALRELINETARGPWERLDTPDYAEIRNKTIESPLALVNISKNADFIALAREALLYWLEQAEQNERIIYQLADRLISENECPPGIIQGQAPCDAGNGFFAGIMCEFCWREWAIKMERNKHE